MKFDTFLLKVYVCLGIALIFVLIAESILNYFLEV